MTAPYEPAPPPPMDPVVYPHPAPARVWRPLENRLLAVQIVFWMIVGVWLLAVVSGVFELLLANRLVAGENVPASELTASDTRQMLVAGVQWVGWVAGAIVFIMWLYRAYQNVDATAPGQRRYGYGWAIGGWFVPILNFWRPKQIVNDVARSGEDSGEPGGLLLTWWLVWIANGLVASSAQREYTGAGSPEEWRTGVIRYLVADGLGALAALLAILVAVKLTRNLNARARAASGSSDRHPSYAPAARIPAARDEEPDDERRRAGR